MSDDCLVLRAKPKLRIIGKDMAGQNCVRVFRQSPTSICVQLRLETRFVTASLSFDEACKSADLINAAVGGKVAVP